MSATLRRRFHGTLKTLIRRPMFIMLPVSAILLFSMMQDLNGETGLMGMQVREDEFRARALILLPIFVFVFIFMVLTQWLVQRRGKSAWAVTAMPAPQLQARTEDVADLVRDRLWGNYRQFPGVLERVSTCAGRCRCHRSGAPAGLVREMHAAADAVRAETAA